MTAQPVPSRAGTPERGLSSEAPPLAPLVGAVFDVSASAPATPASDVPFVRLTVVRAVLGGPHRVELVLAVGQRDEHPHLAGITHLAEHLVIRLAGMDATFKDGETGSSTVSFSTAGTEAGCLDFARRVAAAIIGIDRLTDADVALELAIIEREDPLRFNETIPSLSTIRWGLDGIGLHGAWSDALRTAVVMVDEDAELDDPDEFSHALGMPFDDLAPAIVLGPREAARASRGHRTWRNAAVPALASDRVALVDDRLVVRSGDRGWAVDLGSLAVAVASDDEVVLVMRDGRRLRIERDGWFRGASLLAATIAAVERIAPDRLRRRPSAAGVGGGTAGTV